jgi:hypothetical protein
MSKSMILRNKSDFVSDVVSCFSASCMWVTSLFMCVIVITTATYAAESATPEITAQGFDISDVKVSRLGDIGRLRVRFEVPERIEELYIRERSYEVDLAKTPETDHFNLFGIDRQVRQLTDVTLDFQRYINDKLNLAGEYEIELRVTDRKGGSASAVLLIRVLNETTELPEQSNDQVAFASFRFTRNGAADVSGAEALGISWKTVESNLVVIELAVSSAPTAHLFELVASDYDRVVNKTQLSQISIDSPEMSTLNLTAAGNRAAGSVFGVLNDEAPLIVKITGSHTALSEIGTTVTLEGEYKH